MVLRATIVTIFGVLLSAAAWADDVYLRNGGVFEDVVTRVTEAQVRILLPIGEMALPVSDVLRRFELGFHLE